MAESNNTTQEIWKPIPNYEGLYEVSSHGRVRRTYTIYGRLTNRVLRQKTAKGGYKELDLSANNKQRTFKVHKLVALAFIGICPEGYEINHIDAVPSNNHHENLEYKTHLGNMQHRSAMNRTPQGEQINTCKLSTEEVREIRAEHKHGRSSRAIAKKRGLNRSTIMRIVNRVTWKHID